MLGILLKAIEWLIVLAVLFTFVLGAWRHTVEQTLGDPLLDGPSPNAKAKRYFTLFGKVIWNITGLVVMVGAVLVEFMGLVAENTSFESETNTSDDFRYKHEGERYYTQSTPGNGKSTWY